jgi:hypothetical protein
MYHLLKVMLKVVILIDAHPRHDWLMAGNYPPPRHGV